MKSLIESLLYIAGRPLSFNELAKLTSQKINEIEMAVKELVDDYTLKDGGIKIIQNGGEVQMVTDPKNANIVQNFLEEELSGELTPASIETLSIIAYRQPVSRETIEQIRGVNCAIILRNLSIRGLIEEERRGPQTLYRVSLDFLRHLGVTGVQELPNYQKLHSLELTSISEPANDALSNDSCNQEAQTL